MKVIKVVFVDTNVGILNSMEEIINNFMSGIKQYTFISDNSIEPGDKLLCGAYSNMMLVLTANNVSYDEVESKYSGYPNLTYLSVDLTERKIDGSILFKKVTATRYKDIKSKLCPPKKLIKPGMVVVLSDNTAYFVCNAIRNGKPATLLISDYGFMDLKDYNDSLSVVRSGCSDYDIVKIYSIKDSYGLGLKNLTSKDSFNYYELIWER